MDGGFFTPARIRTTRRPYPRNAAPPTHGERERGKTYRKGREGKRIEPYRLYGESRHAWTDGRKTEREIEPWRDGRSIVCYHVNGRERKSRPGEPPGKTESRPAAVPPCRRPCNGHYMDNDDCKPYPRFGIDHPPGFAAVSLAPPIPSMFHISPPASLLFV